MAEEAAVKAAPVIKDATSKAAAYAQEKSPIVQEKALKLIEEVKASHASHMEIAKTNHDAYTKAAQEREDAAAAYIRTMYQIDTTPESPAFIQERFHHDGKYLNFLCVTGEVLETEKRAEINFRSGHSVHASGGGFLWDGTGRMSMNVSSHSYLNGSTTTAHEFWLRLANGVERPCYIHDSNIPLRKGQRVSLIFSSLDNNNQGTLVVVANHNARAFWQVASAAQLNQRYDLYTVEPGFLNRRMVTEVKDRLLLELQRRIDELGHWALRHQAKIES